MLKALSLISIILIVLAILLWMLIIWTVGEIAIYKNRNMYAWTVWAMLFNFIALLLIVCLPVNEIEEDE